MSSIEQHLDAIYRAGMELRDNWWRAFTANLDAQARMAGSMRRYIAETEFMVQPPGRAPQPPPIPQQPLGEPWGGPLPPLPDTASQDEMDAMMRQFEEKFTGTRPLHGEMPR